MANYANASQRSQLIAGLRDLAEYLESNPDVPTPWSGTTVYVFPPDGSNDQRRAEIDAIASRISVQPCEFATGHYVASRCFGPVEYRAIAIDRDPDDSDGE
jgi:hypothetical protein